MVDGSSSFDKLYPREVSQKLTKGKMILVIYASAIEPVIIYGIRFITKKNKDSQKKCQTFNSEC